MVMVPSQSCCGYSLKTGTTILGALNILVGFGNLLIGIATAALDAPYCMDSKKVFVGVGTVLAVVGVMLLLVSLYLVSVAQKDKPALLIQCMVATIFVLAVNTILHVIIAVQYLALNRTANGAVYITLAFIHVVIETFLLVMYSLHTELKETTTPTTPVAIIALPVKQKSIN